MLKFKENTGKALFLILFLALTAFPITAQVNSSFTNFTPGDSCGSRSVNFDGSASSGAITEYQWKFKNLNTGQNLGISEGTQAYKNFLETGSYSVQLLVKDALGNADSSRVVINVFEPPVADFNIDGVVGCSPHEVVFTDNTTTYGSDIKNWEWDYNDGQKDNFTNSTPTSHSYSGLKKYSPTLIVTDENGCRSSITKRDSIRVYQEIEPVLSVTNNNSCSLPHTVTFTNNSNRSDDYIFVWDFGNGEVLTTNDTTVTHTYNSSGTYGVSLTAQSNEGTCSNTVVTDANQRVSIGIPVTNFTLPASVCQGEELFLEAEEDASGLTNTGTWLFEDDNTEQTGLEATHSFNTPGNWKVLFVAYNSFSNCFSDTLTKSLEVVPSPTVDFNADVTLACKLPVEVGFSNNSSGAIRYEWDFKDATPIRQLNSTDSVLHSFNSYGTYDVTLTGYNIEGCSSSVSLTAIEIKEPSVSINLSASQFCESVPFKVNALVETDERVTEYNYNFSDGGTFTSTSSRIPYQFSNEGSYTVQVSVLTENGCSATSAPKEILVKEYCTSNGNDTTGNGNIGAIKITKPNKCTDKYKFVFEDTSKVTVLSWDFNGDVITGNTNPISYTFTEEDTSTSEYLVTMEALDPSNNPLNVNFLW